VILLIRWRQFTGENDMSSWTDERVKTLKKLWADGLSGEQIAGELGDITRNAVIGKVHRLGLSGRAKTPAVARRNKRPPRIPRLPKQTPAILTHANGSAKKEVMSALDAEVREALRSFNLGIPTDQRRTLLELNENTCRWPIGDPSTPEFFFCGDKPLTSRPYCHHHSRIAFSPPPIRHSQRSRPWR
jgi:GcrA cell cycle regulator